MILIKEIQPISNQNQTLLSLQDSFLVKEDVKNQVVSEIVQLLAAVSALWPATSMLGRRLTGKHDTPCVAGTKNIFHFPTILGRKKLLLNIVYSMYKSFRNFIFIFTSQKGWIAEYSRGRML